MKFNSGPLAGKVENQGAITTPGGGQVYLIAADVENSGVITAPNGDVLLAAGKEVLLVDKNSPEIAVVVAAPEGQSLNLGSIVADAGRIGIYGSVVRQKGRISADSAVAEGGKIFLKATKQTVLDPESKISADGLGRADGGKVMVWSDKDTQASGVISAKGGDYGGNGGFVEVSGKEDLTYQALTDTRAPKGATGTLLLDPGSLDLQPGTGTNTANTFYSDNIAAALNLSDVILQTDATGNGDIIFAAGAHDYTVENTTTNKLTLLALSNGSTATGNISIPTDATITMPANAPLSLIAGWDGVDAANPALASKVTGHGNISMAGNASIVMNGGNLTIRASGEASLQNATTNATIPGSITVESKGDLTLNGALSANGSTTGGQINLTSAEGNVLFSGTSGIATATGADGKITVNVPLGSITTDEITANHIEGQNVILKTYKGVYGPTTSCGDNCIAYYSVPINAAYLDVSNSGTSTTFPENFVGINNTGTGTLTLKDLDTDTYSVNIAGTTGNLNVQANGPLDVQGVVNTSSAFFASSNNPVTLSTELSLANGWYNFAGSTININQNISALGLEFISDNAVNVADGKPSLPPVLMLTVAASVSAAIPAAPFPSVHLFRWTRPGWVLWLIPRYSVPTVMSSGRTLTTAPSVSHHL